MNNKTSNPLSSLSKILRLTTLATSFLAFVACGEDAKEVANNISEDPALNGTFQSECAGSDLADLSYRDKLVFTGNKFSRTLTYFQDSNCSKDSLGGSLELSGDFLVDAESLETSSAGAIEIQYDKATVLPKSVFFVDASNAVSLCGIDQYKVNETKEITSNTSDSLCPVRDVPETIYGAYKLDSNRLFLNRGGFGAMEDKKSNRPVELSEKALYIKE